MHLRRASAADECGSAQTRNVDTEAAMRDHHKPTGREKLLLLALGLCSAMAATGCQVDVNGQTLPSPYYLTDDIQYFPPGPEFKLSQEAAKLKQYTEDQALQEQQQSDITSAPGPMRR